MKKKSLSAKKIIHKKLLSNLKDPIVKKVYFEFCKILNSYLKFNRISVAVSGGPDSLALAYLSKCYSINNNIKVNFYHVNHNLRKESFLESKKLKSLLKKFDINCQILEWRGKKPLTNIQSIARTKRYSLMYEKCNKDKIKYLLLAHHLDDIFENFLIRLLRGSGLKGLISLNDFKTDYNNLQILRPLINFKKSDLIKITIKIFNFYLKDSSNENTIFKRIRLRSLIDNLKKEGLNENKLKLTLKNLTSSNYAINHFVRENINLNTVFFKKKNTYILKSNFFEQPQEIVFRSFSYVLKKVGKKYYSSRGKSIDNLINVISSKNFKKTTLSRCIIEKVSNSFKIYPEMRKKR
tara:strand:- start:302 stop:1354 length:1053 start_codon:yes stop_codon:yes gene_type:complete